MNRYHIQRNDTRTTVTLDSTICELLALKLGIFPDTKDSHKEVRQWLQNTCDKQKNSHMSNLSQWLKRKAILHIADNSLLTKHSEWQREIDQSWTEELTNRVDDVDSGKVVMRSSAEVMKHARAKELNMDSPSTLEVAPKQALSGRHERQWKTENRTAVKAYNGFVEDNGCFSDEYRNF